MDWLAKVLPFLEHYPIWVKGLISGWVLLTAVCIVALIVGYPKDMPAPGSSAPAADPAKPATSSPADEAWLRIERVELYDSDWEEAGVRVTAQINGNSFTYPSIGKAQWVLTGPDMSPGLFKLPPSDSYQITFTMLAKHRGRQDQTEFVSQRQIVVGRDRLPFSGKYSLHELGSERFRGRALAATITFTLAGEPG